MNYYNPYFLTNFEVTPTSKINYYLSKINIHSILNGTQKTLNIINQAIPIIKEAAPMMKNAKTMFKIMNEFKKDDTTVKTNKIKSSNKNTKGPHFFI